MPSWREVFIFLLPNPPLAGPRFTGGEAEDDDDPPVRDDADASSSDESRRIVEEAIRRREEAEHEWGRSWEPEKPAE
jgi:hypothetical protein